MKKKIVLKIGQIEGTVEEHFVIEAKHSPVDTKESTKQAKNPTIEINLQYSKLLYPTHLLECLMSGQYIGFRKEWFRR